MLGRFAAATRWVVAAPLLGVLATPGGALAQREPNGEDETRSQRPAAQTLQQWIWAAEDALDEAHEPHLDLRLGPLEEPRNRTTTGTSWLPSTAPTYALIFPVRRWGLLIRGNVLLGYGAVSAERGAHDLVANSTLLVAALGALGRSELTLRTALSLESVTRDRGNAVARLSETASDVDRAQPNTLLHELAAAWRMPLGDALALELYAGLPGAPALGPVDHAFRPSAYFDPTVPLTRPVLEPARSSPGVVTAGLFGRTVKLEGSVFRAPRQDPAWYGIDVGPLDSGSVRLAAIPDPRWAFSLSYGALPDATGRERTHHVLASVAYGGSLSKDWRLDATLVAGVDTGPAQAPGAAGLLEATAIHRERHVLFGRAQWRHGPQRLRQPPPTADLQVEGALGSLSAGYVHSFRPLEALAPGLGLRGEVVPLSSSLQALYGSAVIGAVTVFAQLRQASLPGPRAPRSTATAR